VTVKWLEHLIDCTCDSQVVRTFNWLYMWQSSG